MAKLKVWHLLLQRLIKLQSIQANKKSKVNPKLRNKKKRNLNKNNN